MKYQYKTSDLLERMVEEGISKNILSARMLFYRLNREKKLILPTLPNSNHTRLTQEQMDEVIRELLPGGSGQWHFGGEV